MDKSIIDLLASDNINNDSYYIAILDGSHCKSLQSFLKEIGRVFKFPSYYGENINAMDECLNDLEWIEKSHYYLLIKNSPQLLTNEPEELKAQLISLLQKVSGEWANVPNYEGEDQFRKRADFKVRFA